jgi:acyl-CoA dehydrogenase
MDFAFDERTLELRDGLVEFMDDCVYPAEPRFRAEVQAAVDPWATPPVIEELKAEARSRGLWNLFLPGTHDYGAGLTNLQYAPLAEITGRSVWIAPEALNCSAPDTGNMELLSLFGTDEQKRRWLEPLLGGRMRSAFSMTEPAVASSDATNIATRIERGGPPRCSDTTTVPTAGMPRSSTTTFASPPPICSVGKGTASRSPRSGWAREGSTIACGRSGWRSVRLN